MKNIRTLILCSSAVLCSWLIASYSYEPKIYVAESADTSTNPVENEPKALANSNVLRAVTKDQGEAANLTTMATIQGK